MSQGALFVVFGEKHPYSNQQVLYFFGWILSKCSLLVLVSKILPTPALTVAADRPYCCQVTGDFVPAYPMNFSCHALVVSLREITFLIILEFNAILSPYIYKCA